MIFGLLQLALVIHVLVRSNAYGWFIALMLARLLAYVAPGLASTAIILVLLGYLLTEVLGVSMSVRTYSGWNHQLFRHRDVNRYRRELQVSGSLDARLKLAKLLLEDDNASEAYGLVHDQAVGVYADDPALLEVLAEAQLRLNNHQATLDTLARIPSDITLSEQCLLIKAQALEQMQRLGEAKAVYESIVGRIPGLEVKARLAGLCQRMGMIDQASQLSREVQEAYALAPGRVKREQRKWLDGVKALNLPT